MAWQSGRLPCIEEFLDCVSAGERTLLLSELVAIDIQKRRALGERPALEDYIERFPDQTETIKQAFLQHVSNRTVSYRGSRPASHARRMASSDGEATDDGFASEVMADAPAPALPARLGRYVPRSVLGVGGFGTVYLAHDDELERDVAIKVPHSHVVASLGRMESLLREARLAAGLRHPAIVRVLDVSPPSEDDLFVVLEYIDGKTLADLLEAGEVNPGRLAEIVATIADAVHYAHTAGLVHRDLKPSNILVDSREAAFVSDFGLAIHDDVEQRRAGEVAGTPHYMAPEQVRGEAHRLDGRTDVWALGVILYVGLCGRLPFKGLTRESLFDEILNREPKPARQVNDRVPRELERISLKCLTKRMADRYLTARDLARDLRLWLAQSAGTAPAAPDPAIALGGQSWRDVRVVPKGLRAFDSEDADFFLSLLPGPRDRDGLPESIRAWKTRIEATTPDRAFPVGLLYGPSGCGKSSLVRAGLLPRLAGSVKPVYIEAAADDTEGRLLAALRRSLPFLPADHGLADTAAAIREGLRPLKQAKVLLVIDQFEQWLYAHVGDSNSEFVQAMRQCDGRRLQAMVLVRDDFWMGITRFMRAIEVPISEGFNSAAVELFDKEHARRLLVELGRAYNRLAEAPPAGSEASQFLSRAVAELAGAGGWIIPVRLSLFAEMVKHRPWVPATLRELGGIEGIGVTFLEETLGAASAPPAHRAHRRAALAVLEALLPEPSSLLKGTLQPSRVLQQAAGYSGRDRDFAELVGILDHELRMVTPVDVEGLLADGRGPDPATREPHYQLTHDFLVPPLRQWLTQKERETVRGRARLCLGERTALWTNKREAKQLASWREWMSIILCTDRKQWTAHERRMMRAASRLYLMRSAGALAVCAVVAMSALYVNRRLHERSVSQEVHELYQSDWPYLPELLDRMAPDVAIWRGQVAGVALDTSASLDQRTRAALALQRHGPEHLELLNERLLDAGPSERMLLRDELARWGGRLGPALWQVVDLADETGPRRLSAASALAVFDPDSPNWDRAQGAIVADLIAQDPLLAIDWVRALRPVRMHLRPPLLERFADRSATEVRQVLAASILADYAEADPAYLSDDLLAKLVMESSPKEYPVLHPLLRSRGPQLVDRMKKCLAARASLAGVPAAENQVDRQANAAEALAVLDHPEELWPRLKQTADPRLRTRLIDRLAPPRFTARGLLERLAHEQEASVRQAILIGLGSGFTELAAPERARLALTLLVLYETDPDPGVHGAAEWILRRWGLENEVTAAKRRLAGTSAESKGWFVTPTLRTMIVARRPGRFLVGSPDDEPDRDPFQEHQHEVTIDYSFAVSTHEETYTQFRQYQHDAYRNEAVSASEECPVSYVNWKSIAGYCNWLTDKEGMGAAEHCYVSIPGDPAGLDFADDFTRRHGYRLLTDDEWEYAGRAGAATIWFFGNTEADLEKYAWYSANSRGKIRPVGLLEPNPLGLFDIYGNIMEFCENTSTAAAAEKMKSRGGDFRSMSRTLRSAMRTAAERGDSYSTLGFRIARTLRER